MSDQAQVSGLYQVEEVTQQGMVTLRGDLGNATLQTVCTDVTGMTFPKAGEAQCEGASGLCWMSPDELLLLTPHADVETALDRVSKELAALHHLAVDVSDARARFRLQGPFVREGLARLMPIDFAPGQFEMPMFRRSRLAQVPAAIWMTQSDTFQLICFRSHRTYVRELLETSANTASVGIF